MSQAFFLTAMAAGLLACERPAEPHSAAATPASTQGVVDSILPLEEQVRRFKAKLPTPPPTELVGGETTRDALVASLIRALENSDTAATRRLVVDPSEFIEFYYPHTEYTRRPYRQGPDIVWLLMQVNNDKGITRALTRFGGKRLGFSGYRCKSETLVQEQNRLWTECTVKIEGAQDLRLFGPIFERNGQFKFLSYTNDL